MEKNALKLFITQRILNIKWVDQLRKTIEIKGIEVIINKLAEMHGNTFKDRCYSRGEMPYPNNLLTTLFCLAESEGTQLTIPIPKKGETKSPVSLFKYKDYYFSIMWGVEATNEIYDSNKNLILEI